jgi:hypothetical protein
MSTNDEPIWASTAQIDELIASIDDDVPDVDTDSGISDRDVAALGSRALERALGTVQGPDASAAYREHRRQSDQQAQHVWRVIQNDFALAAATSGDSDEAAPRVDVDPTSPDRRLVRTALPNGDIQVAIEIGGQPDSDASLIGLTAITRNEDRIERALVLTPQSGSMVAEVILPPRFAYSDLGFSGPFPVDSAPATIVAVITPSVRDAPTDEKNRWRRLARALSPDHPVYTAVRNGLR